MIPSARFLVLYWAHNGATHRPAIQHHLRFLEAASVRHQIAYYNVDWAAPPLLGHLGFDAVVLHTTLLCLRWTPAFPLLKWQLRWLNQIRCPIIAMPQDEYDHSEILDEWLFELGVSVVCSNFDQRFWPTLYPLMHTRARFLKLFTGYIDEATAQRISAFLRPAIERPLDIVYRAAHLPYEFGSHGQLKHRIATAVLQQATAQGLRCDISTRPEDTISTDHWFTFLASSRAIIGCESGSSVLDRRGEIRAAIRQLLRNTPDMSFEEASGHLPAGWDDYRFFALGPRHFEAVMTKTCQILVEGEYDGVLKPDCHYLPLKRDFSNLAEVLEKVKDPRLVDELTTRAYEDVLLGGHFSYRSAAAQVGAVVANTIPERRSLWSWQCIPAFVACLQLVQCLKVRSSRCLQRLVNWLYPGRWFKDTVTLLRRSGRGTVSRRPLDSSAPPADHPVPTTPSPGPVLHPGCES